MSSRPRRAAIYARVSSLRQQKQATIHSQVTQLRCRVEQDHHQLLDEHILLDDGHSGSYLDRPGLDRLRDLAKGRTIDLVYIHSPDRLARRYVHQVLLMEELERFGCDIVFLKHAPSKDPDSQLLTQIPFIGTTGPDNRQPGFGKPFGQCNPVEGRPPFGRPDRSGGQGSKGQGRPDRFRFSETLICEMEKRRLKSWRRWMSLIVQCVVHFPIERREEIEIALHLMYSASVSHRVGMDELLDPDVESHSGFETGRSSQQS